MPVVTCAHCGDPIDSAVLCCPHCGESQIREVSQDDPAWLARRQRKSFAEYLLEGIGVATLILGSSLTVIVVVFSVLVGPYLPALPDHSPGGIGRRAFSCLILTGLVAIPLGALAGYLLRRCRVAWSRRSSGTVDTGMIMADSTDSGADAEAIPADPALTGPARQRKERLPRVSRLRIILGGIILLAAGALGVWISNWDAAPPRQGAVRNAHSEARIVDVICGEAKQVTGVLHFTFWVDSFKYRILPKEAMPTLIENPQIAAPNGIQVTPDGVGIELGYVQSQSWGTYSSQWQAYRIDGTWTILCADDMPEGYHEVEVAFPMVLVARDQLGVTKPEHATITLPLNAFRSVPRRAWAYFQPDLPVSAGSLLVLLTAILLARLWARAPILLILCLLVAAPAALSYALFAGGALDQLWQRSPITALWLCGPVNVLLFIVGASLLPRHPRRTSVPA